MHNSSNSLEHKGYADHLVHDAFIIFVSVSCDARRNQKNPQTQEQAPHSVGKAYGPVVFIILCISSIWYTSYLPLSKPSKIRQVLVYLLSFGNYR